MSCLVLLWIPLGIPLGIPARVWTWDVMFGHGSRVRVERWWLMISFQIKKNVPLSFFFQSSQAPSPWMTGSSINSPHDIFFYKKKTKTKEKRSSRSLRFETWNRLENEEKKNLHWDSFLLLSLSLTGAAGTGRRRRRRRPGDDAGRRHRHGGRRRQVLFELWRMDAVPAARQQHGQQPLGRPIAHQSPVQVSLRFYFCLAVIRLARCESRQSNDTTRSDVNLVRSCHIGDPDVRNEFSTIARWRIKPSKRIFAVQATIVKLPTFGAFFFRSRLSSLSTFATAKMFANVKSAVFPRTVGSTQQ